MKLDGLMFDYLMFYQFVIVVGCVKAKASFRPRTSDEFVMHVVDKWYVLKFIGLVGTKKIIVLCELLRDWFWFLQHKRPEFHMLMLRRVSDERESKCVQFLEK